MQVRKLEIQSVEKLHLFIQAYEKLSSDRANLHHEDQKKRNKTISLLSNAIRAFVWDNSMNHAVFKNDKLLSIHFCNSAILAVKKVESSFRNQLDLDFSVFRTFVYNDNHEYSVALLASDIDLTSSKGMDVSEMPIFKSTLEYFYVEDRPDVYDLYPSMPV